MPTALVNGVRLNFVQIDAAGDHARQDLVAVHGLATNLAFWYAAYGPAFSKRFRVTLIDMRGHGRSEMSVAGYSPGNLARDLAALLDHLHIERAHFLTHSYGGVVAMSLASEAPHRVGSLVLADAHISCVRNAETPQAWGYGRKYQPLLDRYGLGLDTADPFFGYKLLTQVARWRSRGDGVPAELAELIGPLMGSTGPRTAGQWLDLMDRTSAPAEIMGDDGLTFERLRMFRFPILAMYGDNSHARQTGDRLLEVWPHAEFRRVREAGHFFPASRPEEVIDCCERFWAGELADSAARQRTGDAKRRYFRSDRVFSLDGAWYGATREKDRIGPFAARKDAWDALASLIPAMQP